MTVRYTVKQVSGLTGVATDRLRAWERRYGVVEPGRSESRYRLYDDEDVARSAGWPSSSRRARRPPSPPSRSVG
ncbi:MerR family transcriptional regulator [Ornithinimicrobium sp. W1665]|uniref:MerR family transcriptional regulator n=1 Tax=Ornithinimicrobium sp. W1665 TaxID=3416666 RepID=UPI003D6BE668